MPSRSPSRSVEAKLLAKQGLFPSRPYANAVGEFTYTQRGEEIRAPLDSSLDSASIRPLGPSSQRFSLDASAGCWPILHEPSHRHSCRGEFFPFFSLLHLLFRQRQKISSRLGDYSREEIVFLSILFNVHTIWCSILNWWFSINSAALLSRVNNLLNVWRVYSFIPSSPPLSLR